VLVEDYSSHGSFLNGQRIDGTAELSVGDRLQVGVPGIELESIAVTEDDGAAQD
jgi:pSer/pThr/pTyr-binding forkhead associated (FHA) protein